MITNSRVRGKRRRHLADPSERWPNSANNGNGCPQLVGPCLIFFNGHAQRRIAAEPSASDCEGDVSDAELADPK
jgi:hypothetical protein